ncbi:MAG: hypothetical protein NT080_03440 [Spirochaetes bacterium]|nr:hypothetical protein [Spirochaetota bacterium]
MDALEIIVREGPRKMLQAALEAEIEEYLSRFKHLVESHEKPRLNLQNPLIRLCRTPVSRRARVVADGKLPESA